MTGLNGVNAREFELFAPNLDFDAGLSRPGSEGVPGRDPYPRIERDGQMHFMEGEQRIGAWTARKAVRGMMRRSSPKEWAVEDGEWLNEELASRGGVEVSLTDLRLVVVIPPTRGNDQMSDRNPGCRRGEGRPVGLTTTERLTVPIVVAASRGRGPLGRFVRELMGDFPPRACHLALENVAAVSSVAKGRRSAVRIDTQVSAGQPDARPRLSLDLILGEAPATELAGSLGAAIRERWLGADLPAALRDRVAASAPERSQRDEGGYVPLSFARSAPTRQRSPSTRVGAAARYQSRFHSRSSGWMRSPPRFPPADARTTPEMPSVESPRQA